MLRGGHEKQRYLDEGLTVEEVNSPINCAEKLFLKRNDLWATVDLAATFWLKKAHPEMIKELTYVKFPSLETGTDYILEGVLAYMKSNKPAVRYAKVLEAAFQTMKKDGSYFKIIEKYWGGEVPKEAMPLDMQ